jgi:hypothetical protein
MVSELWRDKDYIANVNDNTTLNVIRNYLKIRETRKKKKFMRK